MVKIGIISSFIFFSIAIDAMSIRAMTPQEIVTVWAVHEVLLQPNAPTWLPESLTPKNLENELIATVGKSSYTNEKASAHAGSLPPAMKAWLLDLEEEQKMTILAREKLRLWKNPLLYNIAGIAFSPREAASHLKPITEVIALAESCQKNGLKTVLASNWNSASFTEIERQHQDVVKLFEHRYTSGKTGLLTSEPSFFEKIRNDLGSEKSYFYVDAADANEALRAAQEGGMKTIEYKTPEDLKLQLVKHKVLS